MIHLHGGKRTSKKCGTSCFCLHANDRVAGRDRRHHALDDDRRRDVCGNCASASAPHNSVSCRRRSRQSEHVSIVALNFSLFVGRQATGCRQTDWLGPRFAGVVEIIHGLLSLVSLEEVKRFTARFICRSFFQGVVQSRLYRAERTIEGRGNLVQRRTREESGVPPPADALPARWPPLREPAGRLPTLRRNDLVNAQEHGSWARASDAESRTAFCCRRPFRSGAEECRRARWRTGSGHRNAASIARLRRASLVQDPRPSDRPCRVRNAQRHSRRRAVRPVARKAVASPAWARPINSRSSSS